MTTKILVYQFLVVNQGCHTAKALAERVGKSVAAVRTALNELRTEKRVERYLGIGDNGKTIYEWYA
jgi:predicted ArsR family transcriptional regulator